MIDLLKRRVVVIHKPGPKRLVTIHKELQRLGIIPVIVETSQDAASTTRDILHTLHDEDLVLSLGGDGTTNIVGNTLLSSGLQGIIFVPLRGGHANDIAHMLNGSASVSRILQQGTEVRCYPIRTTITEPNAHTHTFLSFGYFSIGATAAASAQIGRAKQRYGWLRKIGLMDAYLHVVTWHTGSMAGQFKLKRTDGSEATVSDCMFLCGNRIAKHGRVHASLTEKSYEYIPFPSINHASALMTMARMYNGKVRGSFPGVPTEFQVFSKSTDIVPVQFDGEAMQVQSGSQFVIDIAETAYTSLSVKLRNTLV